MSLNKRTSDYYLQKAIILFHFNKIKSSFDAVRKAQKLAPTNSPGPHFSFAFLYLWNEDYTRALREYRKAERCTISGIDFILDIILFLQNLYKNCPEKKQLLYALAFINEKYFDRVQAIKDYHTFISETNSIPRMAVLRSHAIRRLSFLKNKKN